MAKRHPVLARSDVDDDRFYLWKGERYWSVTTIIGGGIPKYALAPWYGKVVAELVAADIAAHGPHARAHAAVRRWSRLGRADFIARQAAGQLTSLKLDKLTPLDLALRWLKGEPVRQRDAAGEIGSDVHTEAEDQVLRLALDESSAIVGFGQHPAWPERLAGYHESFLRWNREWRPEYEATEATVFNPAEAYAGTLDTILRLFVGDLLEALGRQKEPTPEWLLGRDVDDRVQGVLDYKAGNRIHPEVGLQLSPYARAKFIGLADGVTEIPMPHIEFGAVLHLTPTGYHLRLVRIDDEIYRAFLFARETFRFRKDLAATVLGADLAPAQQQAAA